MELTSPNMDLCIIRYAEIALKGKNRQLFEKKLVDNLKNCLKLNKLPFAEIKRFEGRIFVYINKKDDSKQKKDLTEKKADFIEQATDFGLSKYNLLANVFGVSSISFPVKSTLEPENIQIVINNLIKGRSFNTFRITTKKLDQTIAKSSHEFDVELGSYVETAYKKKVSLKEFDINIQVELIHGKAYVFLDKIKGVGGLPYGIEGRTLALIENKQDLLACLLMMKRGCAAVCLSYHELERMLNSTFLNYGINPKIIYMDKLNKKNSAFYKENICELKKTEKIKKIKNLAKSHKLEDFDKKTIEDIAKFHHIESIVTGQTLDIETHKSHYPICCEFLNNQPTNQHRIIKLVGYNFRQLTNLVEFKPLIGMNDDEIERKIKEMIIFHNKINLNFSLSNQVN